ncbi:MAG: type II secretion system protein GspM [Pseudomonadota bacterium]
MWMQINQAWLKLAQREKQLVYLMVLFLTVVLFYSLIWSPIQNAHNSAKQTLEKSENEWLWLNQQVPLVSQKSQPSLQLDIQTKAGLMSFVQDALKSENLMHQMQELQLTNKGVKISFNEVDAPRLFRWLSYLEAQGVIAKNLQLTPLKPGFTQAQVEFEVVN